MFLCTQKDIRKRCIIHRYYCLMEAKIFLMHDVFSLRQICPIFLKCHMHLNIKKLVEFLLHLAIYFKNTFSIVSCFENALSS